MQKCKYGLGFAKTIFWERIRKAEIDVFEIRQGFWIYAPRGASFFNFFGNNSKLKNAGYLEKIKNKTRAISVPEKEQLVKIPLMGVIAAGEPIEAIRQNEFIAIAKTKLPKNGDFYALRVSGNSMIDENIKDGDVVLVKQQKVAESKQRLNNLIIDYEKILKKFQKNQEKRKSKQIKRTLKRKKCPVCEQKEDLDGRCKCVNKNAW